MALCVHTGQQATPEFNAAALLIGSTAQWNFVQLLQTLRLKSTLSDLASIVSKAGSVWPQANGTGASLQAGLRLDAFGPFLSWPYWFPARTLEYYHDISKALAAHSCSEVNWYYVLRDVAVRVLGQFQLIMANSKSWVCLAHLEGFAMLCKLSFDMQNCGCYLNHYGAGCSHPENFAGCSPTAAFQWRSVLQLKQHNCHGSPWVTMGCRWSPSRSHMSHLLVLDVARCCSSFEDHTPIAAAHAQDKWLWREPQLGQLRAKRDVIQYQLSKTLQRKWIEHASKHWKIRDNGGLVTWCLSTWEWGPNTNINIRIRSWLRYSKHLRQKAGNPLRCNVLLRERERETSLDVTNTYKYQ